MSKNESTVIFGIIRKETDMAILLDDSEVEAWLPKSSIKYNENSLHKTVAVDMPVWLAKDKGFV